MAFGKSARSPADSTGHLCRLLLAADRSATMGIRGRTYFLGAQKDRYLRRRDVDGMRQKGERLKKLVRLLPQGRVDLEAPFCEDGRGACAQGRQTMLDPFIPFRIERLLRCRNPICGRFGAFDKRYLCEEPTGESLAALFGRRAGGREPRLRHSKTLRDLNAGSGTGRPNARCERSVVRRSDRLDLGTPRPMRSGNQILAQATTKMTHCMQASRRSGEDATAAL